mmetsp:Transcript_76854/g.216034  ORF Transcript_76854/g.216034 Transcript_76854/m.216034 type:complete len:210 (-) Transcript_76854:1008-1637(-)
MPPCWHPCLHGHWRPRADGRGHRAQGAHHHQAHPPRLGSRARLCRGGHRPPRPRDQGHRHRRSRAAPIGRGPVGCSVGPRGDRLRPDDPAAETRDRRALAEEGRNRGCHRRRGERCTSIEGGRHWRGHGQPECLRCREGCSGHHHFGRRLLLHRQCHQGGAVVVRQLEEECRVHADALGSGDGSCLPQHYLVVPVGTVFPAHSDDRLGQ